MKIFATNKPIININKERLESYGISRDYFFKHLPSYISEPKIIKYGLLKKIILLLSRKFLELIVWIVLRPRLARIGKLDHEEVNKVYTREAKNYNIKHHLTTRGMDLNWRRSCGWFLSTLNHKKEIKILDLCTGTGLTVKEIVSILSEFRIKAEIVGIDFNKEMIDRAESIKRGHHNKDIQVVFNRGDAMNLCRDLEGSDSDLIKFDHNAFDAVIQMFGMGGVADPLKAMNQILKILKPNGFFYMIDIHRPISQFCGEYPIIFKWFKMPVFESVIYEEGTTPLVLNRLWGWKDVTPFFYLISLLTYQDDSSYWGFNKIYFEYEPIRWWFALPVLPVGKLVVQKIKIDREEAGRRHMILNSCTILNRL